MGERHLLSSWKLLKNQDSWNIDDSAGDTIDQAKDEGLIYGENELDFR